MDPPPVLGATSLVVGVETSHARASIGSLTFVLLAVGATDCRCVPRG